MIRTVTYYECDICKAEDDSRYKGKNLWVLLPEEKTVCPTCAEAITTIIEERHGLEQERYQAALELCVPSTTDPRGPNHHWEDMLGAKS